MRRKPEVAGRTERFQCFMYIKVQILQAIEFLTKNYVRAIRPPWYQTMS